MKNRVFWLKPCRVTDAMPILQADAVMRNASSGIETCAVLDLNILNRFKDYQTNQVMERPTELIATIDEIKNGLRIPGMFVAAGFALGEADESYLKDLIQSYESFFATELSTYVCAPNALEPSQERLRSRKYRALPSQDQQFLSFTYLALLKVHEILVFQQEKSPEAKFDLYLDFMDQVADIVPGIETEVAKHCFFRTPANVKNTFIDQSKKIKENFNKGGSRENRVDRILNGSRDIMYLRSAAIQDGKLLDGRQQDTWLLTCDSGIAALCNAIYFFPVDGDRSKFTTAVDYEFRQKDSYWRYSDKASQYLIDQRRMVHRKNSDSERDALLKRVTGLACELNERLAHYTK